MDVIHCQALTNRFIRRLLSLADWCVSDAVMAMSFDVKHECWPGELNPMPNMNGLIVRDGDVIRCQA